VVFGGRRRLCGLTSLEPHPARTGLHGLVVAAAVLIYARHCGAGGSGLLAAYLAGAGVGKTARACFRQIGALNEAIGLGSRKSVMFLVRASASSRRTRGSNLPGPALTHLA